MSIDTDRSEEQAGAELSAESSSQLSTQPEPVGARPPRPGPIGLALRFWRQLTSMRTALLLLVLLALASIPGSLLPQRSNSPSRVAEYFVKHPHLAKIFDRLSLFDTFHAPWFAAIYAVLFISLIGCVVPRSRMHARAMLRRPPGAPSRFTRLPQSATWTTDLPAEQAAALARASLRRKRFRAHLDGSTVSAEKGYLRETGNLLFHAALLVLLVGVGIGSLFGYTGQILLQQGESFVNAPSSYDAYKPGALTSGGSLSPFRVKLDEFKATYESDGAAKTFDAYVQAAKAGGSTRPVDLRVNHPITFGHAKVYLIGHGYTLHVVIRNAAGQAKFEGDVACIPQNLTTYLSSCVVKAPDTGATVPTSYTDPKTGKVYTTNADGSPLTEPLQFAALLNFAPTAAFSPTMGLVSTYPAVTLPRVVVGAFTGDLGLDNGNPQSVYSLDTTNLKPIAIPAADSVITPGSGRAVPLTDGFTLDVTGVSQYATLQVKDDPAKGLVLIAAALIVIGLLGSLRVRRRRLWLRATPDGTGRTLVEVGGLSRSDSDDFAREFRGLVGRLAGAVPPAARPGSTGAEEPQDPEVPDAR